MAGETKVSNRAGVGVAALALFSIFLWMLLLPGLDGLAGSDAAGNGMSQAFAAINAIVLWLLLGALTIVACVNGVAPGWAKAAALLLVPVSCFATIEALGLLAAPREPPYLWPIILPAGAPPLLLAFAFIALFPGLRGRVPAGIAAGGVLGGVLALSLSVGAMLSIRMVARQSQADALAHWRAEIAAVPANAPIWQWTRLLGRGFYGEEPIVEAVRHSDRRQADAEVMLDRGDFPLAYLGGFDLDPTPAICDKARALLRKQVEPLAPKAPGTQSYAQVQDAVAGALAAMRWLVGYDCSCDAESLAWESMAKGYRDTNFDVYELAELRDPKNRGKILREHPARFSMLTPKAHLKAWIDFAQDPKYHDAALAGARRLDHRTTDAIEILEDKDTGPRAYYLIRSIAELDLQPTPRLCHAALAVVRGDIDQAYRPAPTDSPMSYETLLMRLGEGRPLAALQWLARQGCDAEAEISDAEGLVHLYRTSPDREAMLSSLAALHRKP